MSKRTVALVNHEVRMGGAEVALVRLTEALAEQFSFRAFLPGNGPLADALRATGVEVNVVRMPGGTLAAKRGNSLGLLKSFARECSIWPRSVRALAAALEGADIVITGSTKAHVYGGLAARLAGLPLVWWLHDTVDGTSFGIFPRKFLRVCARRLPHRVVAVSRAAATSLRLPPEDPRIRVLYNGLSEGTFETGQLARGERKNGCRDVGWIGRLVPSKGPDLFLEAAAKIIGRIPEARFKMAGEEDPRYSDFAAGLAKRADELGILESVEFAGYQGDLGRFFRSIDVLAFTSVVSDSLPTVILEAMAAGVPVVAFQGGGVGEIIEDGRTGFLVPGGRVDILAERVCVLLGDRGNRESLAEAGVERLRRVFGWKRWVEAWQRELSDLDA